MPDVKIDKERCKGCELCVIYCAKGCITRSDVINEKGTYPVFYSDKDKRCTGCLFCAIVCPDTCITVHKKT